jgi:lysophospholipase L1-like esterase
MSSIGSEPRSRPERWKLALLAVLPTLLLFGALELGLRLAGFQYSPTPLEVRRFTDDPQGTVDREIRFWNRDGVERFVKDAHQLWVPKRSPLERHRLEPEPGVLRIATLGDSCTAHCVSTRESFPELVERFLNARGGRRVEVLNAGVASYSSFQGLQRLKYAVLPYRPEILTVFFGWNDHWITGTPDSEVRLRSEWETSLVNVLDHSRIYQAGSWALAKLRGTAGEGAPEKGRGIVPRVGLDEYEANLREIVDVARDSGMRVLFITAPQEIRDWHNPDLLPLSTERVVEIHARYNDVVRKVARETRAGLVDLAALVEDQPPRSVIARDGIHFGPAGCRFVARVVAAKIAALYLE